MLPKMSYALNDVCFGQCSIRAKVARFDKFALKEGRRVNEEKGVVMMEGRLLEMREKKLLGRRCTGRS